MPLAAYRRGNGDRFRQERKVRMESANGTICIPENDAVVIWERTIETGPNPLRPGFCFGFITLHKSAAFSREASQRLPLAKPPYGLSAPRTPGRYALNAPLPASIIRIFKIILAVVAVAGGYVGEASISPFLRRQNGGSAAFG